MRVSYTFIIRKKYTYALGPGLDVNVVPRLLSASRLVKSLAGYADEVHLKLMSDFVCVQISSIFELYTPSVRVYEH